MQVHLIPITSIHIARAERQRREITPDSIRSLAASIQKDGLLQPLVVTLSDGGPGADAIIFLVAGERRLEACKSLGWTTVPARFLSDLSETDRYRLEWAENVHRADLSWQERAAAVDRYHASRKTEDPSWTIPQTAAELGLGNTTVGRDIIVVAAARANPTLLQSSSVLQAYNAVSRRFGREMANVLAEVTPEADPLDMLSDDFGPTALNDPFYATASASDHYEQLAAKHTAVPRSMIVPTRHAIINSNFAAWAAGYAGPPFTVLHCDFPYGVNFTNTGIFRKANALDNFYSDEEADYWDLLNTLHIHWDKLVAPAAHIIFWFSMNQYQRTKDWFENIAGYEGRGPVFVDPFPLIWHKSDNKGMMHDSEHKPRRIYETAFLITVGDQRLVRPSSNVVASPTNASLHPSAKPFGVVRAFLSMVVDPTSRVLDPTCGHGSAISAAIELGAREAIGIELDPTHCARANIELDTRLHKMLKAGEETL